MKDSAGHSGGPEEANVTMAPNPSCVHHLMAHPTQESSRGPRREWKQFCEPRVVASTSTSNGRVHQPEKSGESRSGEWDSWQGAGLGGFKREVERKRSRGL